MKKWVYIFYVVLFAGCTIDRIRRSGFTTTKEKRIISLYTTIPINAIPIKLKTDDSFVFCVEREEMIRLGDSILKYIPNNYACRELLISEYIAVIDSIKKANGFVDSERIFFCEGILTQRIVKKLLPRGHLWIRYTNGDYVKKLIYINRGNKDVGKEFYKDKNNLKTIHYAVHKLRGNF